MEPVNGNDIVWLVLKSWQAIMFFVAIIFQAGCSFYMLLSHNRDIKSLKAKDSEIQEDVIKRLYDHKNMPLFVPVETCMLCQKNCIETRNKEYNHLAQTLRDYHDTQKTLNDSVIRMAEVVGMLSKQFDKFTRTAPPEHYHNDHGRVIRNQ